MMEAFIIIGLGLVGLFVIFFTGPSSPDQEFQQAVEELKRDMENTVYSDEAQWKVHGEKFLLLLGEYVGKVDMAILLDGVGEIDRILNNKLSQRDDARAKV